MPLLLEMLFLAPPGFEDNVESPETAMVGNPWDLKPPWFTPCSPSTWSATSPVRGFTLCSCSPAFCRSNWYPKVRLLTKVGFTTQVSEAAICPWLRLEVTSNAGTALAET